ncbi:hypothetical protein [Nocardia sp. BMG111209]|uniref:hypothetical protein n=1 Tax=Nocardia sp. BMG111209 TaxID=1160137 RepID=UPI0018CB4E9D|nr:hypothetical protein [Nocardia sp. BMG111209]
MLATDADLAEVIWQVCRFTPVRARNGMDEDYRLTSGLPLTSVAGDYTGGSFFLCGEPAPIRPVLYASSEGSAGVIGYGLTEALEIMSGLPSWHDCLSFSGGGNIEVMRATLVSQLRAGPAASAAGENWESATRTLSFDFAPPEMLLRRLHAAMWTTSPGYELLCDGKPFEPTLFGPLDRPRMSAPPRP